jgi:hypothetical protein
MAHACSRARARAPLVLVADSAASAEGTEGEGCALSHTIPIYVTIYIQSPTYIYNPLQSTTIHARGVDCVDAACIVATLRAVRAVPIRAYSARPSCARRAVAEGPLVRVCTRMCTRALRVCTGAYLSRALVHALGYGTRAFYETPLDLLLYPTGSFILPHWIFYSTPLDLLLDPTGSSVRPHWMFC